MACVLCGYHTQFRAKGLLRVCPAVAVISTHVKRLKNLRPSAYPPVLLSEQFFIRTVMNNEAKAFTSDPGCTSTPTQPVKIPSLFRGSQPRLGAGSQPEQARGGCDDSAIEFENECFVMGFEGLGFESVFGEI